MSVYSKVVWSEGLFLRPQHFQQQERYFERYVESRCLALGPYSWGFTELEVERDLLSIGKFALRRAAGVFPDGTPFRMPDDTPLPPALELAATARNAIVCLGLPLRRTSAMEMERTADGVDRADRLVRHAIGELEAPDVTSTSAEVALLEVGMMRTRLLLERDVTGAYGVVPVARVEEVAADRRVVLDESFIPTVLDTRAAAPLATFVTELLGLVRHRGEVLSGRVTATGRASAAEIADVLMLLTMNRIEPLLAHHADAGVLHPEALYRLCVSMAGELSTFTATRKRPAAFPAYRHERLQESFAPVMTALREAFSVVLRPTATPVAIEHRRFGYSVAAVADRSLYGSSMFVLAARADLPTDEVRRRFPAQLKLGPVERIRDLVNLQLPGVPVHALPVAPRHIPFHAGYTYFEVDRSHELFKQLESSGGIGMHLTGEFPGLALELWAVRDGMGGGDARS